MPPQLSRLILIFGILGAAFILVTWVARPDSFGQYGHYRGNALDEIAAKPIRYVNSAKCEECHEDEAKLHSSGPHKRVSCQACHGPGDVHVDDPTSENIVRPKVTETCSRCHAANAAKPKNFPQVTVKEHADGNDCNACHSVHNPSEVKEG